MEEIPVLEMWFLVKKRVVAFLRFVTCQLTELAAQSARVAPFPFDCMMEVFTTTLSKLLLELWNIPVIPVKLTFFPSSSPLSFLSELLVFLSLLTSPFSEAPPYRHRRSPTERQIRGRICKDLIMLQKKNHPHNPNNNTVTRISWKIAGKTMKDQTIYSKLDATCLTSWE